MYTAPFSATLPEGAVNKSEGLTGSATLHALLQTKTVPFSITTIARKPIQPGQASHPETRFSHNLVSDLFTAPSGKVWDGLCLQQGVERRGPGETCRSDQRNGEWAHGGGLCVGLVNVVKSMAGGRSGVWWVFFH
jgi:hypothetical protein